MASSSVVATPLTRLLEMAFVVALACFCPSHPLSRSFLGPIAPSCGPATLNSLLRSADSSTISLARSRARLAVTVPTHHLGDGRDAVLLHRTANEHRRQLPIPRCAPAGLSISCCIVPTSRLCFSIVPRGAASSVRMPRDVPSSTCSAPWSGDSIFTAWSSRDQHAIVRSRPCDPSRTSAWPCRCAIDFASFG